MSFAWRDIDPNCRPQQGAIWINGKLYAHEVFRDPYKARENAKEKAKDDQETFLTGTDVA